MTKASLKDIALKAGVSTTLVSYVLNGKFKDRISKVTAQNILEAAQALNYKPNSIARSLKLKKTYTIALIVADISNPFSSYLARIIEDELEKYGYTLIIGSSDENHLKSQRLIDMFINRQVDGFIISPVLNTEYQLEQLLAQQVPLVLIDRYFPALATHNVCIENYKASYQATQHLIEAGRQRIALVSYNTGLFHLEERVRGFQDAIGNSALSGTPAAKTALVHTNTIEEDVARAMDGFLAEDFQADAVLFTSNKLAIAGLKALIQRNVRVPDEVYVAAFDETEAYDLFYSPITYIKQPLAEMGHKAVEIMMQIIAGQQAEPQTIMLPAELVKRNSTSLITN